MAKWVVTTPKLTNIETCNDKKQLKRLTKKMKQLAGCKKIMIYKRDYKSEAYNL